MRTLRAQLAFWFTAVFLVIAANLATMYVRGKWLSLRELSVDRLLLGCAIASLILCPAIVYATTLFRQASRHAPVVHGVTLALAIILPCVLLLASVGPGLGALQVQREYVITPPAPAPKNNMGTVVLFSNGFRKLSMSEAARLKQQLTILNSCSVADLRVVGFASSAPYPSQNEERNLRLANMRAESVVYALGKAKVQAKVNPWKTYDEMVTARRIRDIDEKGKSLKDSQALNRRAEVLWQQTSSCLQQ